MKHLILYLAITTALFSPSIAQSSALVKPFTGHVNKAVSNTIVKKLQTMGFAANDPIYGVTLAAAETVLKGAVVAGSVASTVAAVGSAPVWLSVALGLGAAYEIYDFTMGANTWTAKTGETTVSVSSDSLVVSSPLPAPIPVDAWQSPLTGALPKDYSDPGIGYAIKYPSDLKYCATFYVGFAAGTVCGRTVQDIQDQIPS